MDQQTNRWPADKAVTQYPDRLTVEVDAGDIQAVHEWALAAYHHLEAGRPTEALGAVEELVSDEFLERLMWQPAERVAESLGVDLVQGDRADGLWQSLIEGNEWARQAQHESRRAATAPV